MTAEDALGPRRPFIFDDALVSELVDDMPQGGVVVYKLLDDVYEGQARIPNPFDALQFIQTLTFIVRHSSSVNYSSIVIETCDKIDTIVRDALNSRVDTFTELKAPTP